MTYLPIRATVARCAGGILVAATMVAGSSTFAYAVDCQKDFAALMGARQQIIGRINDFNKKRPTPQAACQALTQLVNSDQKTMSWLETNKAWCQIPDEVPNSLKQQSTQTTTIRAKACGAAAMQAKQIAQMKAAQQRQAGGPSGLPGSGVRLPQGAL